MPFSLAISARYIYSNLTGGQTAGGTETVAGQSIAADISSFYTRPIRIADRPSNLSFGMNISNIGNKIQYTETVVRDFIPINLRIGSSLNTNFDDYNKSSTTGNTVTADLDTTEFNFSVGYRF